MRKINPWQSGGVQRWRHLPIGKYSNRVGLYGKIGGYSDWVKVWDKAPRNVSGSYYNVYGSPGVAQVIGCSQYNNYQVDGYVILKYYLIYNT